MAYVGNGAGISGVLPAPAIQNNKENKTMNEILALTRMFGERYIHCDDKQAIFDAKNNREEIVTCFVAIMDYIRMKAEEEEA